MDIEIALSNSTNLENTYAAFVIHGRGCNGRSTCPDILGWRRRHEVTKALLYLFRK
ncbi:MAG: hypothetical protein NUV74_11680 [Candidatus Brocadiaceae bacterium]|nr:hypothetical protein [Candidatus Brocadiaceae bacterium]